MGGRLGISFAAGFVSVVLPCVLPLVPGYLAALSSVEAGQLGQRGTARRVVVASLPFILGFTVVFVVLGAGAAAIGTVLSATARTQVAGFILVVLGLAFVGLLPTVSSSVPVIGSAHGRDVVFGAAVILVMLLLPDGFAGLLARLRRIVQT